jgi:DNA repair photolyase
VNVAPIIPGLNDQDIPRILAAARDAGATRAGCVLVRLPGSVKQVFEQRLRDALPLVADRVLHRIRGTRGGQLYDPRFGARGRGEGEYADMIRTLFETTAARLGYERGMDMEGAMEATIDGSDRTSGHVDDVQHDGETTVAQRKARGSSEAQLTFGFGPGGRDDGGSPAAKVRP